MAVECLDAVASLRGRRPPDPGPHHADPATPAPEDLAGATGFDLGKTIGQLTSGWSTEEELLAENLPGGIGEQVLGNKAKAGFEFMDAATWGEVLAHLIANFRLGEPAWEALAFRLWVLRVLSYATDQASQGHASAMAYLRTTIDEYERSGAV
jgi:hypothetical protein